VTDTQRQKHNKKWWSCFDLTYNLREILGNQDFRLIKQIVTNPQHVLTVYSLQKEAEFLVRVTVATLTSCPVANTTHINSKF